MAILTASTFQQLTGQAVTGGDLTALAGICGAVDRAVKEHLFPFVPEPTTVTEHVMDAPTGNVLTLPLLPARSITSIHVRWNANGDTTLFTAADLLAASTGYYMPIDRPDHGYSQSGKVFRRNLNAWGYEWRRPIGRLAPVIDPNRGAVMVTYAAGPASVPDSITQAAVLMAAMLYARRATGVPANSENWNGYGFSNSSAFTATSALASPDVAGLLSAFSPGVRGAGA